MTSPAPRSSSWFESRAARDLWLTFLVSGVLLTGLLRLSGQPDGETIAGNLRYFFNGIQQVDSWRPMQTAEAYLEGPHDVPVYDAMLIQRGVKFQYPPSSLLLTRAFGYSTLNVLSWLSVLLVMAAAWLTLQRRSAGTPWAFARRDVMAAIGVAALVLTCYPVMKAYSLGQIQAWINAAFALAVLALVWDREDLAGLALGVICLIKPVYGLIAIWAIARRRWRLLGPLLAVAALGTAAALIAYGLADNVNYLNALSLIGKRGETFFPNQSFNGLVNRLIGNGDSLKFDRSGYAAFHPAVYGATLLAFVLLTLLALWLPRRGGRAGSIADFCLFAVTITITSPVAWDHHYGIVLPVFAAIAPAAIARSSSKRWMLPTLAISYVLQTQAISLTNRLAGSWLGVFQSYMLFGAVLLLVILYAMLSEDAHPAER